MKSKPRAIAIAFCLILLLPACARAYYSPDQGRWISRDPIEERGGANVFALLGNNAVDLSDYLGLELGQCSTCTGNCDQTKKKCAVEKITVKPEGAVQARLIPGSDGWKEGRWEVWVVFKHEPSLSYCAGCCEARTYLKWSSEEMRPDAIFSPAEKFPPNKYVEDITITGIHPGDRSQNTDLIGKYCDSDGKSNRLCGTQYYNVDYPKFTPPKGKKGSWTFIVKVLDQCNQGAEVSKSKEVTIEW
jgi:hypothetical protein